MIKQLIKLWDSFGDRNFGVKIVIPIVGIFFTLGTIAQYYSYSLTKAELNKTTATVEWIKIIVEPGSHLNKYHPLVISLSGQSGTFRVKDSFDFRFDDLKQKIQVGDNITLYTRNKSQTILGWGQQRDIFHIEKESLVLFDIKWVKNYYKSQLEFFALFAIIAWGIYGGYRIKKYGEKKAVANNT